MGTYLCPLKASDKQKEIYNVVLKKHSWLVLQQVKAGAGGASVDKVARDIITEAVMVTVLVTDLVTV